MKLEVVLAMLVGLFVKSFAYEDCPCFDREDLNIISAENYHNVLSGCRESHALGSGIGIYTEEEDEYGPKGFRISLQEPFLCVGGSLGNIFNAGTQLQAETCAQFVRDRCAAIGHSPVEM